MYLEGFLGYYFFCVVYYAGGIKEGVAGFRRDLDRGLRCFYRGGFF